MAQPKKSGKRAGAAPKGSRGFSAEERAAMRERAKELKAAAKLEADREEGEKVLLEKIAEMPASDRAMGERVHAIVKATAPDLMPRTWYGMPAYAKDGSIICFFRAADKFKTRYATLGFSDKANLDEGAMWPTDFALTKLSKSDEKRVAELVKRAVS